jgi:hypothetical protein
VELGLRVGTWRGLFARGSEGRGQFAMQTHESLSLLSLLLLAVEVVVEVEL